METSLLKLEFKKKSIDYNQFIKKFKIKVKKDGIINDASIIDDELIKNKIIKMKIEEPKDVFDYDYYMLNNITNKIKVIEL